MRLFKPEAFQGSFKSKRYFEGWYLKHVSTDLGHVLSFIPGISLVKSDPHSFIQVLNGISGESWYIRYPLDQSGFSKNNFLVKLGQSVFSSEFCELDIHEKDLKIQGRIDYNDQIKYPTSLLSPGIMGWYSFVPYMECKHAVVSVNHNLNGSVLMNGSLFDFTGGKGYIEKDWGVSFPSAWLWVQSNNFRNADTSLMLSVAKIPWMGSYFIGFISFLYHNDTFYLFNTYNKSRIVSSNYDEDCIDILIQNKKFSIEFIIKRKKNAELRAPKHGEMNRMIKESVDSECRVRLYDADRKIIYNDNGFRAGLEVTNNIFDLLRKD
jgi:tocopherol cyclase